MTFTPPDDPADQPQEGDPPFDNKAMLEVLSETQATLRARIKATRTMMAPVAIRAILDGVEPREVAGHCGFVKPVRSNSPQSQMERMAEQMGMSLFFPPGTPGSSPGEQEALCAFHEWLCEELVKMVHQSDEEH